jgi:hypothetical protein
MANIDRLFALFPLAYIVWWFYALALVTWLIPAANMPIGNIGNIAHATWWNLISVVLFLTGGIVLLIICFAIFFMILTED